MYQVNEVPIGFSVFIKYPMLQNSLPAQISSLSRGTPYHHDR